LLIKIIIKKRYKSMLVTKKGLPDFTPEAVLGNNEIVNKLPI